jgi:hypothetical protein
MRRLRLRWDEDAAIDETAALMCRNGKIMVRYRARRKNGKLSGRERESGILAHGLESPDAYLRRALPRVNWFRLCALLRETLKRAQAMGFVVRSV